MRDREEQSLKEARRVEKRAAEEAQTLAREQVRKKVNLDREASFEKAAKASKTRRTEKLAAGEIGQSAKDRARREAYLAREKTNDEAQEARKLKDNKKPPQ